MGGFNNPIIGGGGALVYPSIHSPNFSAGPPIVGWSIDKNGNAFFSGTIGGTDYIINSAGAFFYGGTPAAGNLIASIASAAGADQFNNAYLAGEASYFNPSPGVFTAITNQGAVIQFYNGTSAAGPWTLRSQISGGAGSAGGLTIDTSTCVMNASQLAIGASPPATSDLLEVQGTSQLSGLVTHGAGTSTSSSAPSPGQSLAINAAAAQLSDLTRDYMLYLTFSGAGNVTVQAGPTSAVGRTIYPTAACVAGSGYPVRIPAGWFVKCTGTGSVAIASQEVVGC